MTGLIMTCMPGPGCNPLRLCSGCMQAMNLQDPDRWSQACSMTHPSSAEPVAWAHIRWSSIIAH
jgi:hypothetical protein